MGEFADVDIFFDKLVLSDFVRDHNSVRRTLRRQ
jgi:hypothetical protein